MFPPRPKLRRKLTSKDEDLSDSSSSSSTSSSSSSLDLVIPCKGSNLKKTNKISGIQKNKIGRKTSHKNGRMVELNGVNFISKKKAEVYSTNSSLEFEKSSSNSTDNFEHNNGRKRRLSHGVLTSQVRINKKVCNENSMRLEPKAVGNLHLEMLKDSGFSSCSSQERTPTEEDNLRLCEFSSQEVVLNLKKITTQNPLTVTESVNLRSNSQPISLPTEPPSSKLHESRSDGILESRSSEMGENICSSENTLGFCIFCLSEPKNSVFVHSNFVHLCCCYKCAIKVWKQRKACPICNCKVKNVMKLFVH